VAANRESRVTASQIRATVRLVFFWVAANSLAGALVGVVIALFSGEPGAAARFVPLSVLFANAIGFAAGVSARFVLPRYSPLPAALRIPLAVVTLLAGGAFGSALVIIFNPVFVLYQGRMTLLIVLVDSVVAVIVGLIIYNYERMRGEIERGYRAQAESRVRVERLRELAARSELKALRAQINPHFLFNALNSISALITVDSEAAEATLEKLAGIFRRTLEASERESVTLGDELNLVESYLDIERARFGRRLAVEREIESEALAVPVPPLILQPVVENAVRHGISPRVDGGTVRIEARAVEGVLTVVVEDDGPGVEPHLVDGMLENGYGLRNVRDRLAARYGADAALAISTGREGGLRVELSFPLGAGTRDESA